jgi:hypothetical protein
LCNKEWDFAKIERIPGYGQLGIWIHSFSLDGMTSKLGNLWTDAKGVIVMISIAVLSVVLPFKYNWTQLGMLRRLPLDLCFTVYNNE